MVSLYDLFIDSIGAADRVAQRRAVELLVDLSDGELDTYSIAAPTGTGKSYAALLAGVHNAEKSRRTVIGTSTVLLSDQYARDMSLVQPVFPDVRFFVLKGARHYYCGNKAAETLKRAKPDTRAKYMGQLRSMKEDPSREMPIWCAADPEYCSGCTDKLARKHETSCEYARARREALRAHVVVTTHAMISADMSVRNVTNNESNILGEIHLVIFDEAHKAANSLVYDDILGMSALNTLDFSGVLSALGYAKKRDFVELVSGGDQTGQVHDWFTPSVALAQQVERCWPTYPEIGSMNALVRTVTEKDKPSVYRSMAFMKRGRQVLEQLMRGNADGDEALWWDGKRFKMREMTPDTKVVEKLLATRVAWLSATVGTASKPTYSVQKCGIKTKHFELPNAFDYGEQLSYFVRSEKESLEADLLANMNRWWKGGMVVLTPYHARKAAITSKLRQLVPDELVQDQQPESRLNDAAMRAHIAAATDGTKPVLVGVDVFSTGVDLPGQALTKLTIAGLFPLREDWAYVAWRCRWLESFGGQGFEDYLLPERAITLEQQIGRVIRRESDNGVVCFYVENKDAKSGSQGERIIAEALRKFKGIKELR